MKTQKECFRNRGRGWLALSAVVGVLCVAGSAQATTVSIVANKYAGMAAGVPNDNYGGIDAMPIGQAGNGGGRMLIDFDLSAIPAGSTIVSATLRLCDGGGDGGAGGSDYFHHVGNVATISIRRAQESWTTGATWNTKDGTTPWAAAGGGVLGGVDSSLTSDFVGNVYTRVDFSFTNLATAVQVWVNFPGSNHGFLVRNNDEVTATVRKYMLWNWTVPPSGGGFPGPADARPYLDVEYAKAQPRSTVSIVVKDVAGIDATFSTASYGGIDSFFVGNGNTDFNPEVGRMLIDFDLSAIPSGSTIDSATLRLVSLGQYFGHPGNPATISLRHAGEDQVEDWTTGATWNKYDGVNAWATAGGGSLGGVLSSLTSDFEGSCYGRVDFSFTGLASVVQNWLDNPSSNHGFMIRNNNEANFAVRKYMAWNWTAANAPHLGITPPSATAFDGRPYLDVTYLTPSTGTVIVIR